MTCEDFHCDIFRLIHGILVRVRHIPDLNSLNVCLLLPTELPNNCEKNERREKVRMWLFLPSLLRDILCRYVIVRFDSGGHSLQTKLGYFLYVPIVKFKHFDVESHEEDTFFIEVGVEWSILLELIVGTVRLQLLDQKYSTFHRTCRAGDVGI